MTLELWNTIFAGATFVVIAATAIAAVIQLRHFRASNQMNALLTLLQVWESPEMREHYRFLFSELPKKLEDPSFRAELEGRTSRAQHPELAVADFWEQIGTYAKYGLIDEESWLDIASRTAVRTWHALEPVITIQRKRSGLMAWENFEYIAVRGQQWITSHPNGAYPRGLPRMAEMPALDSNGPKA